MPLPRWDVAEQIASILLTKIVCWMICSQLRSHYSSCESAATGALLAVPTQRLPAGWPGSAGRSSTDSSWFVECPFYFNFRSRSMRAHCPSSCNCLQ